MVCDLGFEGRLLAFEGERLELAGFGQGVEELGNGGDFIGLLGRAELAQDQLCQD